MIWKLSPIDSHIDEIKQLFSQNADHKHADNYLKNPLFEYTKFARMGWDDQLVYYSAGISIPEFNGSIRIMSRHTRARSYNWGSKTDDLTRGLDTLDQSVQAAQLLGFTDIWVSREENPNLLNYFANHSRFNWTVGYETMWYGGKQYVMRKTN
jgi:hypothetical protein